MHFRRFDRNHRECDTDPSYFMYYRGILRSFINQIRIWWFLKLGCAPPPKLSEEEEMEARRLSPIARRALDKENRLWLTSNGHCSWKLTTESLDLMSVLGLEPGTRLESRRKAVAFVDDFVLSSTGVLKTRPFLKVESGIQGRRFFPIMHENVLAAEYLEAPTKKVLKKVLKALR